LSIAHSLSEKELPCVHEHKPLLHNQHQHSHDEDEHSHSHHHHHHYEIHRPQQRRALLICVCLTTLMMVVEFGAGWFTGSLMLISDAIHMLSHAAALGISFLALLLAQKQTSDELPFGLYRVEILAALLNGISIAFFSIWIVYEGVGRMLHPVDIRGSELTVVALIGLAVNLTTAVILQRAGLEDLNTKSAFLHMLADTFSSVAIVIGGIIIYFTNWILIDPIMSMVVAGVVAKWSWGLLRDSTRILLERKPSHLSLQEIQDQLMGEIPEIRDVHDLHVWEITSQFVCASAHIVLDDMALKETQRIRSKVVDSLQHHFGIGHAVIQVEC
jgi:cobalt-zinc-cadmium efflux system protein